MCVECGKGFARSDYLNKHCKIHVTSSQGNIASSDIEPTSIAELVRSDAYDVLLSDAILNDVVNLDPLDSLQTFHSP